MEVTWRNTLFFFCAIVKVMMEVCRNIEYTSKLFEFGSMIIDHCLQCGLVLNTIQWTPEQII